MLDRWETLSSVKKEAVSGMCVRSFRSFVEFSFQFVFRKDFIWHNDLHGVIERELMRVWAGDQRNAILNIPPRYGKTEMLILFCAWTFGHNSSCEFLHLSFSDKLTARNSMRVKEIIKSDFYSDVFSTRIDPKRDAAEDWHTTSGGRFGARPTSGQVTGFGAGATSETVGDDYTFAGMIWIDDPLKPEDAHTIRRAKINDAWHETIKSRRNAKTTPTVVTMQRIHEGDFTAELMADAAEHFNQIKLKALRPDGSALWPFKHSPDDLTNMRDTNLFVFSSQYQQEPTAKGGSIFRADWWRYYLALPDGGFERVIITADTAQKTAERNDFSVFQAWGLTDHRIYLLDQVRGKWEAPQLKDIAVGFIKRTKSTYPKLNAAYIEDKASGTGLIQSLPSETSVPVLPVQRNKDKVTRAFDAAPYVQSGMVLLPEGAAFTEIFVSEHSSFNAEDTHLHDDQVDPMMDAVDILLDKVVTVSTFNVPGLF